MWWILSTKYSNVFGSSPILTDPVVGNHPNVYPKNYNIISEKINVGIA